MWEKPSRSAVTKIPNPAHLVPATMPISKTLRVVVRSLPSSYFRKLLKLYAIQEI